MKLYSPDITKPTEVNYYWHEKVLVEPMPKDEPKQGEWIEEVGDCEGKSVRYICSQCGDDDGWINYNFCPNCGARMKGESDE